MILVDSSVWIDYFNGRISRETDRLDELMDSPALLTGDLILTEVLQGCRRDRDFRQARNALELLEFEPMVDREVALASAANYRMLRSRGIAVGKTIDVLIASFCVLRGHDLLHADRDFEIMAGPLGLTTL